MSCGVVQHALYILCGCVVLGLLDAGARVGRSLGIVCTQRKEHPCGHTADGVPTHVIWDGPLVEVNKVNYD